MTRFLFMQTNFEFYYYCIQAGSPRLHRALFRDKCSNQSQHRLSARSGSQSPGDSGISQSHSSFSGNSPSQTLSQSFSSVSSVSDWSPDVTSSNISKVCTVLYFYIATLFIILSLSLSLVPTSYINYIFCYIFL